MAIWRKGKEIVGRWRKGFYVQETWKYINGAWRLIWQAVRSCFGSGKWVGNKPWIGKEKWKGTK